MDLTSQAPVEVNVNLPPTSPAYVSAVDPFLVEALQNPRHRLTILRMELDVQKFLQNPDLHQFEFPHFPTSYLRLAAHRVTQHYGLQTMVQDIIGSQGIRIMVIKKPESKFPVVCLSEVPAKELENNKLDQIKVVLRPRPKAASSEAGEPRLRKGQLKSVEERKEEYDRARARIFSSPNNSESEYSSGRAFSNGTDLNVDDNYFGADGDKNLCRESGSYSRIAILRDREKDRTDPDYDRSYDRYVKNIPNSLSFSMVPFNMPKFQPPPIPFDSVFPQAGQMYPPQASVDYAMWPNQNSGDALCMPWPTQSMMFAQSYGQLRHPHFQAPFWQQPLSFDYSHNHYR